MSMKEIDFLVNNVKEWSKKFPQLHIKYAYEHSTEFHIIEVEPSSALDDDQEFRKMVHDTWRNFINQFPEAELLVDCKSDAHTMTDVKFDSKDGVDNSIESKFTINDQLIVLKVLRAVSGGSAWKQIDHVCHTGDSYNFSTPNVPSYALAA